MSETFDRSLAAAQSQLDRIDDGGEDVDLVETDLGDSAGMHIEDPSVVDQEEPDDDGLETDHDGDGLADVIDAFSEAFNARDLDGLLDLVSEDCETPGLGGDLDGFAEEIEDLWDRRPTSLLTRGVLDDLDVGVMWEIGDDGSWWRVAPVFFDDPDGGRIGVIEFGEDQDTLDGVEADPPDAEFEEGARWRDWEDGVTE